MKINGSAKSIIVIVVVLVSGTINGCAKTCPKQLPLPETTLPKCNQITNGNLEIGAGCYVDILANNPKNESGLTVQASQGYKVIVHGNQLWYDASRCNSPLCGENGSFIMNMFSNRKKSKDSLWFSLIAEIKEEGKPYDLCNEKSSAKNVGKFLTRSDGRLVLYANDAVGYYDNNCGEIRVEINREK